MMVIKAALLQLFIIEVSISLPLQDIVENKGLLINLTSFGTEDSSNNGESAGPFFQTGYEQSIQLSNSDSLNDDTVSFVVNGQPASRGQFPYQVAIIKMVDQLYGYLTCGGSLISPNYVLTAAHCLYGQSASSNWLAAIGGIDLSISSETGRVVLPFTTSNMKIHESYSSVTYKNDIALIRLPRTVQTSASVSVAKLPTMTEAASQTTFDGSNVVVSGWGRTKDSSQTTTPYLQYGYLTVMTQTACIQAYKALRYTVTEGQFCTAVGTTKSNTCNGDSGGPLVVPSYNSQQRLIGIVSLGAEKCEIGFPPVFTRIGFYLNWIASNSDLKVS